MSSTVKDNASATTPGGGGFFKRIGRKRSLSGVGSPKSPSSPLFESSPWLPPLEGIDGAQSSERPAPATPPALMPRRSTVGGTGPPLLNLPTDIAPPVTAASSSTYKHLAVFKGGPQLALPGIVDTSLHLEVTNDGLSNTTPTKEKPEAQGTKLAPASTHAPAPASTSAARATSPAPSAARATSPLPAASPVKSITSRKDSVISDRSSSTEKTSITKAFGSLFKRTKTRENVDTLSPTPAEDKRKSSSAGLSTVLKRASFTSPVEKNESAKTNGAAKEDASSAPVAVPAVVAGAAAATAAPVVAAVQPPNEEANSAPSEGFAPTGTTFSTNDGEVKTFGEPASSSGFTRPAGFEKSNVASLRAEPAEEPAPVAEAAPAPEATAATVGFAQTGETFTTNDGEVRAFGETAPNGGFARPAGYAGASAAALRAEPEAEAPAPVAELAPTGTTFTTNDGEVKTFGEAAPSTGFARPAGFEKTNVAELRAAPAEEPETAPVAEVKAEEPVAEVVAAPEPVKEEPVVEEASTPAPVAQVEEPKLVAPAKPKYELSSVRALRAQFEQTRSSNVKAAEVFKPSTPPAAESVDVEEHKVEAPLEATEETIAPAEEVVTEELKSEEVAPAEVEEAKPEVVEVANGDAHKTDAENGSAVPESKTDALTPAA
ncbi:hypothetical protein BKA62DRAFT_348533 [Auriculariales sp. MPI-PUGE-AT-0066]|nr:hypothetical protein BKA62DRAFT_348533 [Auriculariales sp. MPI-PUGE-AT-0066]